MENPKKNIILKFRVTESENSYLREKMEHSGIKNMSEFLRKSICNSVIVHVDTSEIHEVRRLVSTVAKNINQIALRVNFQGTIYQDDMEEIKQRIEQIYNMIYKLYICFHD